MPAIDLFFEIGRHKPADVGRYLADNCTKVTFPFIDRQRYFFKTEEETQKAAEILILADLKFKFVKPNL